MTHSRDYQPRPIGRPPKYPWDDLLDGVEKLVDNRMLKQMDVDAEGFRNRLLAEARRRHIVALTSKFGPEAIAIRFPRGSLRDDSKIDYDRYFDGQLRTWLADEVPFREPLEPWLLRLKAAALERGLEPDAQMAHGGDAGRFRVLAPAASSGGQGASADQFLALSALRGTPAPDVRPGPAVEEDFGDWSDAEVES